MRQTVGRLWRIASGALGALLSLSSCARGNGTVIRLATDRPEFAGYAELFNQAQPEYKVEITYTMDPARRISDDHPPDIVVSNRLSCRDTLSRLDALDDLFGSGAIDRDSLYAGAIEMGVLDGRQRALPVSFGLPAVVFKETPAASFDTGVLLEVADLRRRAAEFNRKSGDRFTRVGFSPLWDPSFLVTAAVLGPPSYDSTQDCQTVWRSAELDAAVGDLRVFVSDVNGGAAAQQEFEDRYLYEPYTELLRRDRILFYPVTSTELFDPTPAEGVGFRWLAVEDRIPVLADVLAAGIPRRAAHKGAARVFLRWFLTPATQQAILSYPAGSVRGESFGVAGGFSTLVLVNERVLVRAYPALIGHIPTPAFLRFPQPLPSDWPEISESLVRPWLEEAVVGTGEAAASLSQSLARRLSDGVEQLRRDRPQ